MGFLKRKKVEEEIIAPQPTQEVAEAEEVQTQSLVNSQAPEIPVYEPEEEAGEVKQVSQPIQEVQQTPEIQEQPIVEEVEEEPKLTEEIAINYLTNHEQRLRQFEQRLVQLESTLFKLRSI